MGFLDKITSKTITKASNKMADKISDGIVNGLFGSKKTQDAPAQQEPVQAEPAPVAQPAPAEPQVVVQQPAEPQVVYVNAGQPRAANIPSAEEMEKLMGMAYNTKRCPNCQAVCMNSPVECPYCHADLKGVKPMTPEELEALE
ncbi:MAG: hypothetical protein MJZ38_02045 [archaeon]|nr:hypothetical protein [archaeon]